VFLPLFFLPGIEGRLLRPLGFAYIAALAASLLVSLTVTPVLSSYLLVRPRLLEKDEPWLLRNLKARYRKDLDRALAHPRIESIDVNPLVVTPEGAIAVDALVVLAD